MRILQNWLNRISDTYMEIPKLTVDGVYGPGTENAVRIYQQIFGLTPSGAVGAETWNSIADTYRSLVQGDEGSSTQFGGVIP